MKIHTKASEKHGYQVQKQTIQDFKKGLVGNSNFLNVARDIDEHMCNPLHHIYDHLGKYKYKYKGHMDRLLHTNTTYSWIQLLKRSQ